MVRGSQNINPADWIATGGYLAEGVYSQGSFINGADVSGQDNSTFLNPEKYWDQFSSWTNEIHEQFIYDGYTTTDFLTFLEQLDSKYDTIAIVGHNPEIAMMAVNLCNDNIFNFPTSASISILFSEQNWKDIKVREGKTNWFTYPSLLK